MELNCNIFEDLLEVNRMIDFANYDFREPKSLFDENGFAQEGESENVLENAAPRTSDQSGFWERKEPITYCENIGFWRQQFKPGITPRQRWYDWAFGVILPTICFIADPFVFKSFGGDHQGLLSHYSPFAYTLSFVSIALMFIYLSWGHKYKAANAALSGLFAVGGLVSLVVGVVLLPFSLLGLLVIIGALGLTPLFTAAIYLRNSYRSFLIAAESTPRLLVCNMFMLTALSSIVIPYLVNVYYGTWVNPLEFVYRAYYGPMY